MRLASPSDTICVRYEAQRLELDETMPTILDVGQALGSYDCGYFSGRAIWILLDDDTRWNMMSVQEVYDCRNRYRKEKINGPTTDSPTLVPGRMPAYLTSLGADGYGLRNEIPLKLQSIDEATRLLDEGLANGFPCAMTYGLSNQYHWIAVSRVVQSAMYTPEESEAYDALLSAGRELTPAESAKLREFEGRPDKAEPFFLVYDPNRKNAYGPQAENVVLQTPKDLARFFVKNKYDIHLVRRN